MRPYSFLRHVAMTCRRSTRTNSSPVFILFFRSLWCPTAHLSIKKNSVLFIVSTVSRQSIH